MKKMLHKLQGRLDVNLMGVAKKSSWKTWHVKWALTEWIFFQGVY